MIQFTKLEGAAFRNTVDHIRSEILSQLRRDAEKTGRRDLQAVYEEAQKLFKQFLKERRFELALKLEAGYRPH